LLAAGFLVRRYGSGRLAQAVRISMPPENDFERLKNILIEVLR
jgi:histidinol-phosphate/aromatic aminotransferase/cobyric acid decarboxylase-like protein